MCQWIGPTLIQILACRLFGAKPLSKPMLGCCQLDPKEQKEQTSVKFHSKYKLFIQENACEYIVCEMAAIFSRGRWVNILRPEQNVRHVADNGIKCIFWSLALSHRFFWTWLGFIPDEPIDNNSALVQVMACCRIGIEYFNTRSLFDGKPLPMLNKWRHMASQWHSGWRWGAPTYVHRPTSY